jgi:hypothetical protein
MLPFISIGDFPGLETYAVRGELIVTKAKYAKVLVSIPTMEGVNRLGKYFLGVIDRLGSDNAYTSSVTQEAARHLFQACEQEKADHPTMANICDSLQNSILARCASHATATVLLQGRPHLKAPPFMQDGPAKAERLAKDAHEHACYVLDPANFFSVLMRGGDAALQDAEAYFYQKVLVSDATILGAPQQAAMPHAPDSLADLKAKIQAIKDMAKPAVMESEEYFEKYKKQQVAQIKAAFKNKDALRQYEAGEEEAAGGGGDHDPFGLMLDALRKELQEFKEFLGTQTQIFMQRVAGGAQWDGGAYGLPLQSKKVDARYEFWPSRKKQWPLLYYCATQLLAGSKASTCSNERMHSVSGRIFSKLRASLLPSSVERLTLGYYYIRKEVEKMLTFTTEAMLDKEEIEEDPEAPPEGAEVLEVD